MQQGTTTTLATTTVNGTTLNGGTLALAAGSITDSSGAINFGNENLTTTGIVTAASLDISGNVDVDGLRAVDANSVPLILGWIKKTLTLVSLRTKKTRSPNTRNVFP